VDSISGKFLQRLGVFHLMADGAKFLFKEEPVPGHVNKLYFILAPALAMIPALTTVTVVPFGAYFDEAGRLVPLVLANVDIGLLAIFAVSSLAFTRSSLRAGPPTRNTPSSAACVPRRTLISYELSMTLAVLPVFSGSTRPAPRARWASPRSSNSRAKPDFIGSGYGFCSTMPLSAFIFLVALLPRRSPALRQPESSRSRRWFSH